MYAPDRRVARFVTILSTLNAAGLLVGAIVSLYSINSPKTKLGIIALFTALFAINVGIFTNARQSELFAATAA
jgi:xanthosine utilization system XapX-like protein